MPKCNKYKAIIIAGIDFGLKSKVIEELLNLKYLKYFHVSFSLFGESRSLFSIPSINFILQRSLVELLEIKPDTPHANNIEKARDDLRFLADKLNKDASMQWLNDQCSVLVNVSGNDIEAIEELYAALSDYGYDVLVMYILPSAEKAMIWNSLQDKPHDQDIIELKLNNLRWNSDSIREEFDSSPEIITEIIEDEFANDSVEFLNCLNSTIDKAHKFLEEALINEQGIRFLKNLSEQSKEKLFELHL